MPTHEPKADADPRNARDSSHPDATDSGSPVSSRTILFVVASVALAIACVLLALRYFVAERLPDLTEATLEAAMKQWEQNGPASYDMDIDLRGARPGNVHVEVRAGEVTALTRDGRVPRESTWYVWSVPGMFDMLERNIQIASDPVQEIQAPPGSKWWLRCEFDPKLGFPATFHQIATGGPDVYWRVTNFQPK